MGSLNQIISPCGTSQSSGTFHRAGWLDTNSFSGHVASPRHVYIWCFSPKHLLFVGICSFLMHSYEKFDKWCSETGVLLLSCSTHKATIGTKCNSSVHWINNFKSLAIAWTNRRCYHGIPVFTTWETNGHWSPSLNQTGSKGWMKSKVFSSYSPGLCLLWKAQVSVYTFTLNFYYFIKYFNVTEESGK